MTRQRNQKADTLSGGERRKLEIARALVTDPQLILLDEPFSGVDPIAVEDLQREVVRLKEEFGKSVLITDHNVAQTLRVCDRALIIEDGRVKFEGTPQEVINDPGVRSAYTGNLFRGDEFDEPLTVRAASSSSPTANLNPRNGEAPGHITPAIVAPRPAQAGSAGRTPTGPAASNTGAAASRATAGTASAATQPTAVVPRPAVVAPKPAVAAPRPAATAGGAKPATGASRPAIAVRPSPTAQSAAPHRPLAQPPNTPPVAPPKS